MEIEPYKKIYIENAINKINKTRNVSLLSKEDKINKIEILAKDPNKNENRGRPEKEPESRGGDKSDPNKLGKVQGGGFTENPVNIKRDLILYRYGYSGSKADTIILKAVVEEDPRKKIPWYKHGFPFDGKKVHKKGKNITVSIKKGDYFAIEPDPSANNAWRVYTPYTGSYFYFLLYDDPNIRTIKIKQRMIGKGLKSEIERGSKNNSPFSMLISRSEQQIKFMNKVANRWDDVFKSVYKKHVKKIEEEKDKEKRFQLRIGDIVTNVKGSKENYMIAYKIYDSNNNMYRWILVPEDSVKNGDLSNLADNSKMINTEVMKNALSRDANAEFVDTFQGKDENKIQEVRNSLMEEVNNLLEIMGLSEQNIYPYVKRDMSREKPPQKTNQNNNQEVTDYRIGDMVYIPSGLPDQNTYKRLKNVNRDTNNKINGFLVNNRNELYRSFIDSDGWYIIADKKTIEAKNQIQWKLVPAMGNKIEVKEPVINQTSNRNTDNSTRFQDRPGFSNINNNPNRNTGIVSIGKQVWDYVVLNLPRGGQGSLTQIVERNKNVKNEQRFRNAEKMVQKFDPQGNEKSYVSGDVIYFGGMNYIIGNKQPKGDKYRFLLIPIRSFADPNTLKPNSNNTDPNMGYKTDVVKPKEGRNSIEEEAERFLKAEESKKYGLMKMALEYYKLYEPDGTPRNVPLRGDQINGFDMNKEQKSKSDDKLSERFVQDKSDENKTTKQDNTDNNTRTNNNFSTQDELTENEEYLNKDLNRKNIFEGSVITYQWEPNSKGTREIFYEYDKQNGMIRLVPHQEFLGPPDGWVPASGYLKPSDYDYKIVQPGFFRNFDRGVYDNSALDRRKQFKFSIDIKERFKEIVQETKSENKDSNESIDEENIDPHYKNNSGEFIKREEILEKTKALRFGKVIEYINDSGDLDIAVVDLIDSNSHDPYNYEIATAYTTDKGSVSVKVKDIINVNVEPNVSTPGELEPSNFVLQENKNYLRVYEAIMNGTSVRINGESYYYDELDEKLQEFYKDAFGIEIAISEDI